MKMANRFGAMGGMGMGRVALFASLAHGPMIAMAQDDYGNEIPGSDPASAPASEPVVDRDAGLQGEGTQSLNDKDRIDELANWMDWDPVRDANKNLPLVQGDGTVVPEAPKPGDPPVAPAAPVVDPNAPAPLTAEEQKAALAAIMFGGAAPVAPVVPAPAPAPAAPAPAPAADAPFQPFTPEAMALPPQIMNAILDADVDPQVRATALQMVLAVHANTAVNAAIKRMEEHVLPKVFQQQEAARVQTQAAQAAKIQFETDFPDLKAFPDIVRRAIQVVGDQDRVAGRATAMDKATLSRIGAMARYAIQNIPGLAPAAPAPAAPPAPNLAAGNGYVAGTTRPEGFAPQGNGALDPHTKEMMDLFT